MKYLTKLNTTFLLSYILLNTSRTLKFQISTTSYLLIAEKTFTLTTLYLKVLLENQYHQAEFNRFNKICGMFYILMIR